MDLVIRKMYTSFFRRLVEFADRSSMEYAMDELDNTKVRIEIYNKYCCMV